MIKNYKGVIFDFNGTLFFDNDKHIMAWGKMSELLRGHGIKDDELHKHINGVPNLKVIAYLAKEKLDNFDSIKYSYLKEEYYREFCAKDTKNFHLVKGSEEFFEKLKIQNIPFTIASASIKENIDFFVESFNLDKWMDPELIVYDDGTYENKVLMFKDAAKKIGVNIEDCLIFEDSQSGINNAFQAGCNNIIVVNSADKRNEYEKLPGVISVIEDFKELV